jgi:hypothetical protein
MNSIPVHLMKLNKGTDDEIEVILIPIRSNNLIFSEFQSIIMEAFKIIDIEIKKMTSIDISSDEK